MSESLRNKSVDEIQEMLETSEKGWPYSTIDNAAIILREDSLFKNHIRENMFRQRIELDGKMPWNRTGLDVTDRDEVHIRYYMEMMYHYSSERRVREALQIVATENQYHPVRDYLNSLTWDGNPRIRYALKHFLGAEINDYHEECLKLFLLGAISRVFSPGCKFEYMLCLVGGQGAGKSSFARFLAAKDLWFTDDLKRLDDERVYERLVGHWICEMAEMIPILNTRFIESTKGFLSKQYDNYRVPYSVRAEDRPRQCVFIGTSNVVNFLPLDRSGNRRFLPVMCDEEKAEIHILEDEAASRQYMDQLWAEAMVIYREGKYKLKLPPEIEKNLVDYQRPFMQEDTWTGLIQEWLDHTEHNLVCSYQIYNEALGEPGKPRNSVTREIGLIMNSSIKGWKSYPNPRSIPKYGKQRGWMRVETNSGNEAETFIPVDATQMEIPFE